MNKEWNEEWNENLMSLIAQAKIDLLEQLNLIYQSFEK